MKLMTKHPSHVSKNIQPGATGPGLVCQKCKRPIPIAEPYAGIPENFGAVCPNCGHQGSYSKSEIVVLKAHRKQ
jgi:hypothetical protein